MMPPRTGTLVNPLFCIWYVDEPNNGESSELDVSCPVAVLELFSKVGWPDALKLF
jgi:hypothetical protein